MVYDMNDIKSYKFYSDNFINIIYKDGTSLEFLSPIYSDRPIVSNKKRLYLYKRGMTLHMKFNTVKNYIL